MKRSQRGQFVFKIRSFAGKYDKNAIHHFCRRHFMQRKFFSLSLSFSLCLCYPPNGSAIINQSVDKNVQNEHSSDSSQCFATLMIFISLARSI